MAAVREPTPGTDAGVQPEPCPLPAVPWAAAVRISVSSVRSDTAPLSRSFSLLQLFQATIRLAPPGDPENVTAVTPGQQSASAVERVGQHQPDAAAKQSLRALRACVRFLRHSGPPTVKYIGGDKHRYKQAIDEPGKPAGVTVLTQGSGWGGRLVTPGTPFHRDRSRRAEEKGYSRRRPARLWRAGRRCGRLRQYGVRQGRQCSSGL